MSIVLAQYKEAFDDRVNAEIVSVDPSGSGFLVTIDVWNTFSDSVILASVDIDEGSVISGVTSGDQFAFELYRYEVFLDQINAGGGALLFDYAWLGVVEVPLNSDELVRIYESIHGPIDNRLIMHWPIDWSELPVLNSEWTTEVLESLDGTEQRISLRETPRQSITYAYKSFNENQYQFDNAVNGYSGIVILPMWQHEIMTGVEIVSGTNEIGLTEYNEHIASAKRLFIIENGEHEVVEIDTFAPASIKTKYLVKKNYSKEARIMPAVLARIADETPGLTYSSKISGQSITFEIEDYDTTLPGMQDDFERLDGTLILPFKPDRSTDVSTNYARLREVFDPMLGSRHIYERAKGTVRHISYDFTLFNIDDITRFQSFEKMMAGAQGEFYFEGPGTLTELAEDIKTPSARLKVKKSNIGASQAPAIAIKMSNGDIIHRKVISVEDSASSEIITLNAAVNNLTRESIDYIAPLYLGRFASDLFTYNYQTNEICQITKTIKQLLYADTA